MNRTNTIMQWPPTHGGPIYWLIRASLFKAKRFNRRTLRIILENYDRQRLWNTMQPRLSYDHRCNQWMQSAKRAGSAGVVSVVGARAFNKSVFPAFFAISFFWWNQEVWRQEKHPFQSYMKWRRIHMENAAMKENVDED